MRQKCLSSFFPPTHTTFPLLLHLQNDSSYFPKSFSHHFLLLHYLHLVHKMESSYPLPLHLQNDSISFIIFFYFIIFIWCTKWKSHISFKNPRKFLVYPLILCFIPNPWKNCYSIFFKLSHIVSSSTNETMNSLKSYKRKRLKKVMKNKKMSIANRKKMWSRRKWSKG